MKIKLNKKKGILFWVTGFSGSGKSEIGNKIKKDIEKRFGRTLIINGDNFRQSFKFQNYDKKSRIKLGKQYTDFLRIILNQNINVIFTVVGLYNEIRAYNQKKIENYIEIFIDANIKKIKKVSKKTHYKKGQKNILGLDLKPELPKNPDIRIENNFLISTNEIAKKIMAKINNYERQN